MTTSQHTPTHQVSPGQPQPPTAQTAQPVLNQAYTVPFKDHMTWSILTTLLFMLWCGIAALIQSQAARDAFRRGDMQTAYAKANSAKTWNIVGTIIGAVMYVLVLPLMFIVSVMLET